MTFPKNKDLYDCLEKLVIKALELLNSLSLKEEIPEQLVDKILIIEQEGKRSIGTFTELEPNFRLYFYNHAKEINALQEFKECKDCILNQAIIDKIFPPLTGLSGTSIQRPDYTKLIERTFIQPFLTRYLNGNKSFDFNLNVFNGVYAELEYYLISKTLRFILYTPLINFDCEEDEIRLGKNLKIRKITSKEINILWNSMNTGGVISEFEIYGLKYCLEMPRESRVGEASNTEEVVSKEFDCAVYALRLFKSGNTGYRPILSSPVGWSVLGGDSITYESFQYPFHGPVYKLSKSEAEEFKLFWGDFKSVYSKQQFLTTSINRFNFAYERERPDDKLIDYMISLESLFLRGGEKTELEYRLSLRLAFFLGKDLKEIETIFNETRKAYRLRSNIIHGSTNKSKHVDKQSKISTSQLTLNVENYTRSAIKKFIEMIKKQSYEDIIKQVEKSIFDQNLR